MSSGRMLATILAFASMGPDEQQRALDRKFGNVDLRTTPWKPPPDDVVDERVRKAAEKRARKAQKRHP